jgi:chromosome segregation ATPase
MAIWLLPFVPANASGLLLQPGTTKAVNPDRPDLWQLKREVQDRERQAAQAQCDLAEARARLAEAEGKRKAAVEEWGKVVTHYERQLRWIEKYSGTICDIEAELAIARWHVAEARSRLAYVRGEKATLVAELKKVVAYHEWNVKRTEDMLAKRAIIPEELKDAKKALADARKRLKAANGQ